MNVIMDERTVTTRGLCENCNKFSLGRQEQIYGWLLESRGYYFLCFDCLKPRVFWRPGGKHKKIFFTPTMFIAK